MRHAPREWERTAARNRTAPCERRAEGGAERTFQLRLQLTAKSAGGRLGLLPQRRQLGVAQCGRCVSLTYRGGGSLQSSVFLDERTLRGRLRGQRRNGSVRERVALEAPEPKATPGRAQPPRRCDVQQAACSATRTHQLRARVLQLRVERLDVGIAARDALLAQTKRSFRCSCRSARRCRLCRASFAQRVQLSGSLVQLRGQRADVAAREGSAVDAPVFRLGQSQRADQRAQLRQQTASCSR